MGKEKTKTKSEAGLLIWNHSCYWVYIYTFANFLRYLLYLYNAGAFLISNVLCDVFPLTFIHLVSVVVSYLVSFLFPYLLIGLILFNLFLIFQFFLTRK